MFTLIDRVSAALGTLAAWAYFVIALMLGYEVVMRYVFVAPTIWAEELSRLLLVWATFAGMALLVHRRQHIAITLVTDLLPERARRWQQVFVLGFVAALALAIVWYGSGIALDSLMRGRTTGSMLDMPAWINQASIPVCFLLLALQAIIEALRVAFDPKAARPSQPRPEH